MSSSSLKSSKVYLILLESKSKSLTWPTSLPQGLASIQPSSLISPALPLQKPSPRVPSFLPIQDPLSGLSSPTTSPSPFPQLTLPYPSVLISVVSAPVECSLGSSLGQGDVLNILQYRMLLRSTVYS